MSFSEEIESEENVVMSLPWDHFHNWIHCICVVTFDLELGQAMELIYPTHAKLTEKEKLSICYLSFPDSNSGCTGDTKFHFRIRRCPTNKFTNPYFNEFNKHCPTALQVDVNYLYGYVYFRQMKDRTIRRGYFQKSVVIISKLQFINFFSCLNDMVAPQFFDVGIPSLEAACHNIDQWPPPNPGQTLNLPIAGSIIQTRIPCRSDKLINMATSSSIEPKVNQLANVFIPSIHEVDSYSCFLPILNHVQLLWELVLTCEPLVVMAPQPSVSSSVVHALVNMVWPIRYACDYRPYFTIHDSEFKEYATKTQSPPSVILGVTNPFFVKTLQHWPHIFRIGEASEAPFLTRTIGQLRRVKSHKTLDVYPGLYTKYIPFLKRDKTFLKKLMKGMSGRRPPEVQNAILKRHLLELTQSFMIPLERYIGGQMPLARNISPHLDTPRMKPFDHEEFTRTIEHSGPQLTSGLKGNWVGLYRKFFATANFECWLRHREKEINQKLKMLHVEALCHSDLDEWLADKKEVQKVDLIIRMNENLRWLQGQDVTTSNTSLKVKLRDKMMSIVTTLPTDLQTVFN